jgi:hypothetical protein
MKRNWIPGIVVALVVLAPVSALADGGIGRAGSYNNHSWMGQSTKTRAEVRAELNAAYSNGTLPEINHNSYPNANPYSSPVATR